MTREEIMKRIEIEDARIANADRNIEGLILQKNKSLDEQARLWVLLEALPPEEPEQPLEQGGLFYQGWGDVVTDKEWYTNKELYEMMVDLSKIS